MLLENFKKNSSKRFNRANRALKENYGIGISKTLTLEELETSRNSVFDTIQTLKMNGRISRDCPELSKNLLVMECIDSLLAQKRVDERANFMSTPRYQSVIEWLSDYIAKAVDLGDDIDDATDQAMKEYRSSKWRFPDVAVRHDAKNAAWDKMGPAPNMFESFGTTECDLNDVMAPDEIENVQAFIVVPNTELDPAARGKLHDYYVERGDSPGDEGDVNDWYFERIMRDFGHQLQTEQKELSQERITEMKNDFVKQLRALLESEVDEAEIIIAVKGIGKTVQEMIEKIGRLQNEDLPPLSDQVRETYGTNIASNFQMSTAQSLQSVMDTLYSAKDEIDATVVKMASGAGELAAEVDMDISTHAPLAKMGMGLDGDIEDGMGIDDELDGEFGGADAMSGPEDEPLGRARIESLSNKLGKMKKLVSEAKKLKAKQRA